MLRKRNDWGGFAWSPWTNLKTIRRKDLPPGHGIYLLRTVDPPLLSYVGQAVLQSRIAGDWRRVPRTPTSRFEQAGSQKLSFLSEIAEMLGGLEVSWTQGPIDISKERWRKGHEARLLWLCRRETGRSALANYGRASDSLNVVGAGMSSPIFRENFIVPSSRPLEPDRKPVWGNQWMGLHWTPLFSREELKYASPSEFSNPKLRFMNRGTALYKAFSPDLSLLKVGYVEKARQGSLALFRDLPEGTLLAWSNRGICNPLHRYLELVSDLIGAHLHQTGDLPSLQF